MLPICTFAAHHRRRFADRARATSPRPGGLVGSRVELRRAAERDGSGSSLLLLVLRGSRAVTWRTQLLEGPGSYPFLHDLQPLARSLPVVSLTTASGVSRK